MRFLAVTTIIILLLIFGVLFLLLFKGQIQLTNEGTVTSPRNPSGGIIAPTTTQNNNGGNIYDPILPPSTSSIKDSGFKGPTGPPHIIGPSTPPPKN